ncbi:extracellular ligand-binding receptor [Naegleria gruberi]|uniref:Extracellular ligand-binding receptor n=1 Tax=Naegleria gruberi TaxID=5762 RepID=D2UXC0_NAEGR|nr:extracellular ligand-binding receptor [Naegleria gruberi]EFC50258.1 extracellular ligand-binding receptor [Naegleria gruberi]|eukprot:XP_002683002.1 extracellular ligand-binding receptor [Naegleria gruberi strain NEG-M]
MSLDDSYEADKTLRNVNYYLNLNQTFFGFIGFFGSRTIQSVYKRLTSLGYPLIGSYTGAQFLRTPFNRNIINVVRPSYYDEVVSLLDYLFYNKDARKISIFYQTDIFGSDAFTGVVESLQYFGVKLCSQSPYNVTTNNLNDIEQSVKQLAKCNPDSIIIVALTNATQTFLNHVVNSNLFRKDINIVATSINSDTLVRVLGYNISSKIIFNQAVPDPIDITNPLVASFQKARKVYDPNSKDFGSVAELEGYLIGKFTYNLLQRTSGNLTRNNFLNELYYSQEILIDRMRIGTFTDCSNSSGCLNECNQGSKTFWRDRVTSENILKTVDVFTWYSVCTSTPSSIRFPYLIGQIVFKHENYSKINTFLKEGIYNGLSLKNINGNEIHLLTLEYENFQDLISKTIELITSYNVVAITGITGLDNFNEQEQLIFKNLFLQNFTEIPIIGLITEDPNLMSPSGSNFLPSFINLKTSVIEQIATLLEYTFERGFTRISIVYDSKNYKHIYEYLSKLLKIVNLEIESEHNCEENILFNATINPHAILVSCNNVKNVIEQIDNYSNFRNDGLLLVLNDIFLSDNINNLFIKRKLIYSTPFNHFNNSSIYLLELFSMNTKYTQNQEYFKSDIAIEGFYIGDFISFIMDSLSDAGKPITGKSFIEYLYSIENINLHGQVIGTFSNVKLPLCNFGIRQRYVYQLKEKLTEQVYTSKFSTEQCGLQQAIQSLDSSSYSRPFQFIKLVKTSVKYYTDSVIVEYQDDFIEGVNSYFLNLKEDSSKYYPFTFQIVTKLYTDNNDVKSIIKDLISKQHMFAFIDPDISDTLTASYLIEQSNINQIPIISSESSNLIFRKFSKNVFNLLPSIIDQSVALINYFISNFPSKSIIILLENDNYWYENDWINDLSDILEDGFVIKIKIQSLNTYRQVKDDILLIFTQPNNFIQYYYSNIHNLQDKPIIGLISDIYNTIEISEFLYSLNDPSFIYTPVIELLNVSSYVTTKFHQVFQNYNSTFPSSTNKVLNGFITALFIDEVFESFINLKNKSRADFLKKVYEISSFELGDLKIGSFIDCTSTNNSQCMSCNQGIRSMIIAKTIRIGDFVQLIESGRYSYETCGVVASTKDLTSHILLFVLVILITLVIIMIILLSILISYKIITKGKESQYAPISKGTFAFTDIQNSTFLWQTNEKAMKIALSIHNKIMRRNIKIFKGYEVKTVSRK